MLILSVLGDLGVKIFIGHKEENINPVSVIVRSSAVKDDNAEIITARKIIFP